MAVDCDVCETGANECKHTLSDDERAADARRYLEDIASARGVGLSDLTVFLAREGDKKLHVFRGGGIKDNPERRYYEYTAGEAIGAIRQGASGFGLYLGLESCGSVGVGIIDNDDPDGWPYHATPTDYTIRSGSGAKHHPFLHDGSVGNANSKKETPYEGSIRTSAHYHLIPGSIHPSGGVYTIEERAPIPMATEEDFPTDLRPRARTETTVGGEKLEMPEDPPESLEGSDFTNAVGWSLEEVRARDSKLDGLLTRLAPPGYGGDRSTADAAAVRKLWFWGFDRQQIVRIIRKYRRYEKTKRDDYLKLTINFAANGERVMDGDRGEGLSSNFRERWLTDFPENVYTDRATREWAPDERGSGGLTREEVWERTAAEIRKAQSRGQKAGIDAIMGAGKTYNFFKVSKEDGRDIAYFCARNTLKEQAVEMAKANGYDEHEIHVLPSAPKDCETFRGEHGAEWKNRMWGPYQKGARPSKLHERLDPPCTQGDRTCTYQEKLVDDLDQFDVVIGEYSHAHLPHATSGRHVAIDEWQRGAYWEKVEGDDLTTWVNSWLAHEPEFPYDHIDEVRNADEDSEAFAEAMAWFEANPPEEDEEAALADLHHAQMPEAVYTMLAGVWVDDREYGYKRAIFPGGGQRKGVYCRGGGHHPERAILQDPPDLNYASSVLALDGTFDSRAWQMMTGVGFQHRRVLSDQERQTFIRDVQNNVGIRANDSAKTYSSGKWVTERHDGVLFESVAEKYGEKPVVFAPNKAIEKYRAHDDVGRSVKTFDNYASLRGSNEYADESLAVVSGSTHYGDTWMEEMAAFNGEAIESEGKGMEKDYGGGQRYLYLMREAVVAQSAMRVGRGASNGAVVVFNTAAVPDWYPIVGEGSVTKTWTDNQRDVALAIREIAQGDGGVTVQQIAEHDAVSCTERNVYNVIETFAEVGYVDVEKQGRRMLVSDAGLHQVDSGGQAELPAVSLSDEDAHKVTIMPSFVRGANDIVPAPDHRQDLTVYVYDEDGGGLKRDEPPD